MKRRIVALAISFILFFILGCQNEDGNQFKIKGKIAVVVSTMDNQWFVVLADSAKNRAEELGYEAKIFDSKNDISVEAAHFDEIIARGYKAILFNPTDAERSIPNVINAKRAGIPTFCMDRELKSNDAAVSQILTDSYTGCVELGRYFVDKLNRKGNYVELLGVESSDNTWSRSKGFHSVVDKCPGLKMVAQQSADYDRKKATAVLSSMLRKHSNIDAVFCGNDAMAMGAYDAMVSAGKESKVLIMGFDGAEDVINAIMQKKISATVMQFPKLIAKTTADMADKYIKDGKRNFQRKIYTDVRLITEENVGLWKIYWMR
ncbi:MAG: D-ribose ABC transporter substrate-binding protein [Ignavibacteriae bacterium]|nr:MAG: D-ribose ABC transporter substrate-binding protein [Ignavibacteriota bacterium]